MEIGTIIEALPESEQRKLLTRLQKLLNVKKRQKIEIPTYEQVAKAGKIISTMDGYNIPEMRSTLKIAMNTIDAASGRLKNPKRLEREAE